MRSNASLFDIDMDACNLFMQADDGDSAESQLGTDAVLDLDRHCERSSSSSSVYEEHMDLDPCRNFDTRASKAQSQLVSSTSPVIETVKSN